MAKIDVELTPVPCKRCHGSKQILAQQPGGDLDNPRPMYSVQCPECTGLGFTAEMKIDAHNLLKLITPKVTGTATFTPPAKGNGEDEG